MPGVSIIIPTYNRKDTLPEALSSVFSQRYQDVEIIVIDHGSTDGTVGWMKETYGSKVRLLERPYCPLPACPRNAGLEAAQGKYVAFLDSDDVWLPEKLARQVEALETRPDYGWSYGNAERFGTPEVEGMRENGPWQFHSGHVFEALIQSNFVTSCTVFARKTCLDTVGYFDMTPRLRTAEDYELWLRLAYRYKAYPIRQPIARYRVSATNLTQNLAVASN